MPTAIPALSGIRIPGAGSELPMLRLEAVQEALEEDAQIERMRRKQTLRKAYLKAYEQEHKAAEKDTKQMARNGGAGSPGRAGPAGAPATLPPAPLSLRPAFPGGSQVPPSASAAPGPPGETGGFSDESDFFGNLWEQTGPEPSTMGTVGQMPPPPVGKVVGDQWQLTAPAVTGETQWTPQAGGVIQGRPTDPAAHEAGMEGRVRAPYPMGQIGMAHPRIAAPTAPQPQPTPTPEEIELTDLREKLTGEQTTLQTMEADIEASKKNPLRTPQFTAKDVENQKRVVRQARGAWRKKDVEHRRAAETKQREVALTEAQRGVVGADTPEAAIAAMKKHVAKGGLGAEGADKLRIFTSSYADALRETKAAAAKKTREAALAKWNSYVADRLRVPVDKFKKARTDPEVWLDVLRDMEMEYGALMSAAQHDLGAEGQESVRREYARALRSLPEPKVSVRDMSKEGLAKFRELTGGTEDPNELEANKKDILAGMLQWALEPGAPRTRMRDAFAVRAFLSASLGEKVEKVSESMEWLKGLLPKGE